MKKVALSELKDDLSKCLRLAETEEIVITRHGRPAGILMGFACEDDWFDYQLENDPRFLKQIEQARESLRNGKGVKIEDVAKVKLNKAMNRSTLAFRQGLRGLGDHGLGTSKVKDRTKG